MTLLALISAAALGSLVVAGLPADSGNAAFMPHGMCFLWNPRLLALHVAADAVTAVAYCAIAAVLFVFVRRRSDLPFRGLFAMFGTFIVACAATHAFEIWTIWHAGYWLSGTVKAFTAAMSLATASVLAMTVPQAMTIKSPRQLHDLNERLAAGERRYRVLTDTLPQLVGVIGADGRLRYGNRQWSEYTGFAPDDPRAVLAGGLFHADDAPAVDERLALLVGGAVSDLDLETRLRRADGSYRWHRLRVVTLDDPGRLRGEWLFTLTDVDERKLAEAVSSVAAAGLREDNRLLLMAEQMTRIAHWRVDLRSQELIWSREVYRTCGLPTTFKPTLADGIATYHPDDRAKIGRLIARAIAQRMPFAHDSRIVRPDGSIRNVTSSGQPEMDADGEVVAIFGVLQDITDAKEAERERSRLLERVALATQTGKVGIWEWDLRSDEFVWDASGFALYGLAPSTVVQSSATWLRSIHPEDAKRITGEIQRALGGAPFDAEYRIIWPNGEVRHIQGQGTVVRDAAGVAVRMVGTNSDVTDIRLVTEQLQTEKLLLLETVDRWTAAKEAADEANQAKSDFLARMSHEIRTPMNGVIGLTTLVLNSELNAEQRRHMLHLRDAGHTLMAVISDILDFSKIEAGKIVLERVAFAPRRLIEGTLSMLEGEARTRGLALGVDIAPDVPDWIIGDPTRLRQVLLNLITNALKFTERGHVEVGVRYLRAGSRLDVTVSDTGIGIAPEQRHLLFTDFSQVDSSTTRRFGGTGLGLAISKRLIDAMGGTIGVHSRAGAGSTFWFSLSAPHTSEPASIAHENTARIARRRILVADDNEVNQIVVDGLLTGDGHDVTLVADGAAAVQALRVAGFDLVLMDMEMPVLGGLDATRQIRALDGPAGAIPIVALTANATVGHVRDCRDAGMNGYLAKPIDHAVLRETLAFWTSNPHESWHETPQAPGGFALRLSASPELKTNLDTPAPADMLQSGDLPLIEVGHLLKLFKGDRNGVAGLLHAALDSITADAAHLLAGAATGDLPEVARCAHRIKGTSGTIRCAELLNASALVDDQARTGDAVEPSRVDALLASARRVAAALESHIGALRSPPETA